MKPLFVDVHVLQTVPPSNINRDDAGSPKQAVFGGVRRARVSSQAWKRATRLRISAELSDADRPLSLRTRRLAEQLDARFTDSGAAPDEAQTWANECITLLDIDRDKGKRSTSYLLFLGTAQIDKLASEYAAARRAGETPQKDRLVAAVSRSHPADVALFGRMVADLADLRVDAAVQVAHALSTHGVEIEFDYFTAVDDAIGDDETGAGMIGTVEFTSATLYRFATVGVHQLSENLDHDERALSSTLSAFLRGFVLAMPSGHRNAFAHGTPPLLASFVVRDDQPMNLVAAFELPVTGPGIAQESVQRLAVELERCALWGAPPLAVHTVYGAAAAAPEVLGEPVPLAAAVERTVQACLRAPVA